VRGCCDGAPIHRSSTLGDLSSLFSARFIFAIAVDITENSRESDVRETVDGSTDPTRAKEREERKILLEKFDKSTSKKRSKFYFLKHSAVNRKTRNS